MSLLGLGLSAPHKQGQGPGDGQGTLGLWFASHGGPPSCRLLFNLIVCNFSAVLFAPAASILFGLGMRNEQDVKQVGLVDKGDQDTTMMKAKVRPDRHQVTAISNCSVQTDW